MCWRRPWHPTPVLLPGKSHGRRSLVGCSPWGREELDTTKRLHFHFSLSHIGEGNGNQLQCSCLENPRDRGAWWTAVYGVAQSRTRLKWRSRSSVCVWLHSCMWVYMCIWAHNKDDFLVCETKDKPIEKATTRRGPSESSEYQEYPSLSPLWGSILTLMMTRVNYLQQCNNSHATVNPTRTDGN